MSLLIGDNLVVSMHYKLTDNEGNVLDSSEGAEPLTYLHGSGNIIPGLEKELLGKVEGATQQVKVEPEEGYGEINPEEYAKILDYTIYSFKNVNSDFFMLNGALNISAPSNADHMDAFVFMSKIM